MNYISNLIQNFVQSFGEILNGTFGSLASTLSGSLESTFPTVTYGAATTTSMDGSTKIAGDHEIVGTSMVATGSALSSAVGDTSDVDVNLVSTQAYVEAMSDKELEEFIIKLENTKVVEFDCDNRSLSKTYKG